LNESLHHRLSLEIHGIQNTQFWISVSLFNPNTWLIICISSCCSIAS
jgi:hypothetical protein